MKDFDQSDEYMCRWVYIQFWMEHELLYRRLTLIKGTAQLQKISEKMYWNVTDPMHQKNITMHNYVGRNQH